VSSAIVTAPAVVRPAARRTRLMPPSAGRTSICTAAATVFENSNRRLENSARSARAAVVPYTPISLLLRTCSGYGLVRSTPPLPGSLRRTRLCLIRHPGNRLRMAFRSSTPGRPKTFYVSSDLGRDYPEGRRAYSNFTAGLARVSTVSVKMSGRL